MNETAAGITPAGDATSPVDPIPAGNILQALVCARRDEFAESLAYVARAREQLPPAQAHLAELLDAFVACQSRYHEAQRILHEASLTFAAASTEQQAQIAVLEAMLPRLALSIEDEPPAAASSHSQRYPPPAASRQRETVPSPIQLPALAITCFGRFTVWRDGERVQLCQNRNGQAILRYLAAQPRHRETIDRLMAVLWPEDEPEVARHKLHVAISALRRALNGDFERQKGGGYLICESGAYGLNLNAGIEIDVDAFLQAYQDGQRAGGDAASSLYEGACRLYTGMLLPEDLYTEWSSTLREQLLLTYLAMCSALAHQHLLAHRFAESERWATAILAENRCDEAAHRVLLRTYAAQRRRSDVIRQYRSCERALADELGVAPMAETTAIFEAVLRGEPLDEASLADAAVRVA